MKTRSFLVTIELPPDVGPAVMRAYIREAVQTWCKTLDFDNDPLFDLKASSVTVKIMPKTFPAPETHP